MKIAALYRKLLLLIVTVLLSSCSNGGDSSPAKGSVRLVPATDCSILESRLKEELVRRYDRMESWYLYGGVALLSTRGTEMDGSGLTTAGEKSGTSYSTTNLQEKGVDEGDLVKTDGEYIYLARGSHFLVLKARPAAETSIVSDIDMGESISELYLDAARVMLVTAGYEGEGSAVDRSALVLPPGRAITRLYSYDVTDRAHPDLKVRYDFPGILQGSRRINGSIYLVTNHSVKLAAPAYPWDYLQPGESDQDAYRIAVSRARAENMRLIDLLTLSDMLPVYSQTPYSGGVSGTTLTAPAVSCQDIYIPDSANGTDISLVFSLDFSQSTPQLASTGVLSSWCTLYMSPESLYLASGNSWAWIEPVAANGTPPENPEPWTALHKFALGSAGGKLVYRGSGRVNGWLNNQFSMGEYGGYLRIATTRGGWWGEGISNQLTILAEQGDALVETGMITGLAPGERIYSMRFDHDRGYMVTFRQTDPLFTFDLSDPAKPRQTGEIHVNGFATYMHLMGESNNRLLTIGRSADASGRVTGNKLQLFDVTNLASPALLGDFELGSGWSAALHDHHAFLYYDTLSLLAIPYYSYTDGISYSSGLRLFKVEPAGIREHGSVAAKTISTGYGSYADTVDRAVVIGGDIYAVAHRSVTVADIDTLSPVASVVLPESYPINLFPVRLQ